MSVPTATTRIHVILARRAPTAIVFRRGPSKQVLTLRWDTASHEFRIGQWLKARIYEHRCDLSPSGEKLIYFAASYRGPFRTWTAVSRPPYLTALALWPKGDAWGGGGLFENERTISLNHRAGERKLAAGTKLPKTIAVEPLGKYSGRGEDDPIWSTRLLRDGWVLKQEGTVKQNKFASKLRWEFPENKIWTKQEGHWSISMRLLGVHERDGPWYVVEHEITDAEGNLALSLGRSDWADWSQCGEILFAKEGRLFRIRPTAASRLGEPEELIDLRELRFEAIKAPAEAQVWSGCAALGTLIR